MEIRILGPLEAGEDGRSLDLGPPKQRALLALLTVHRGEFVSADRLIDELWDGRPPAAAGKSIQVYVSQLRKPLGTDAIESRSGGYSLRLPTDVDRFDRLAAEGRNLLQQGHPSRAAEVLREALSFWRGPPLADVAYLSFAQSEIARLEELHLAAVEERIEADLACGRESGLVPELQRLVREFPVRERLRGQLMLALYRTGRQAEALETYRIGRATLRDELGLEPSRELQELEQAILRQDAVLGHAPRPRFLPVKQRVYFMGAAVVAGTAAAAALAVGLTWGGNVVSVAPESLAVVDPASNRLVGDVALHALPGAVTEGGGSVWVTSTQDRTLFRIDPQRQAIVKTVALPGDPAKVAFGDGAVWLTYLVQTTETTSDPFAGDSAVLRVDPQHGYLQHAVNTHEGFGNDYGDAIAANARDVWVVDPPGDVTRIDAASSSVTGKWRFRYAYDVAVGSGPAWVLTDAGAERIPAKRGSSPVPISLGTTQGASSYAADAIAVGGGSVWTANFRKPPCAVYKLQCAGGAGSVFRIDPGSNLVDQRTTRVHIGQPVDAAYGDGSLWIVDERSLLRVDPAKNRVVAKIALPYPPVGVATGNGRVWVAVGAAK